jgi:hypothetical protein
MPILTALADAELGLGALDDLAASAIGIAAYPSNCYPGNVYPSQSAEARVGLVLTALADAGVQPL